MKVREIMTSAPACCTRGDTVKRAAELMEEHDCGCLPVVDEAGGSLVGVVTDRDLALRTLGRGAGPDALVGDAMTSEIHSCGPDDDLDEVERVMATHQVRRVPVLDEDRRCLGIIAQADLARHHSSASDAEVRRVVERISEPAAQTGG